MRVYYGVYKMCARDGASGAREVAVSQAIIKLIDETERMLLALLDDELERGDYPYLARAIEAAKAELEREPQLCTVCETAPVYTGDRCAGCLVARDAR